MRRFSSVLVLTLVWVWATGHAPVDGQQPVKVFISVDMEGIGGIGTSAMTSATGKDYATGRRLMTDEVNAVVAAIFARGPAESSSTTRTATCRTCCTPSSTRA